MKTILFSTAEAEYFALTEVIKEILGVKNVLETVKLKVKMSVLVYYNNFPVIHLINNSIMKTKTQHINIKFYWIYKHIENGTIIVHHTPTESISNAPNITPLFSKPIVFLESFDSVTFLFLFLRINHSFFS